MSGRGDSDVPSSDHEDVFSDAESSSDPGQESDGSEKVTNSSESPNSSPLKLSNSPPSSPVRHARKRPFYSTYRDDPSVPIPRQTLHSWKKKRSCSDQRERNDDEESNDGQDLSELNQSHGGFEEEVLNPNSNIRLEETVGGRDISSSDSDCDSESGGASSTPSSVVLSEGVQDSEVNSSTVEDEFSEHSDHDESNDPFEDNLLYPGCEKSKDVAILELMDIYLTNHLTKTSLEQFLCLYVSSLPSTHNMPPSVYHLFNYVKKLSIPIKEVQHFYCRPKLHSVESTDNPCKQCKSTDFGCFYELPLDDQIKYLFEHRGLADVIDKEKRKERPAGACGIKDGSEYLRVWDGDESEYKVTLILNTDGVKPFNDASSSAKLWPILFTIMEVPPHLRSSFTLVWGVWFDKEYKPDMNMYLEKFVSSLVKIHEDGGITWSHPKTRVVYKSHVKAPLIVADAPARAMVLVMQEHQGKFACNSCEQKTNKLPADVPVAPVVPGQKKKKRKRRFVFREEPARLRTHTRMIAQGQYAIRKGIDHKHGIKSLAVMRHIPGLDLSTCVTPDYMHCLCKGIVLQFGTLWFHEKGDWYIGNHMKDISTFFCSDIHPPDFVTRLPKSMQYFTSFKANEMRSFLLYYSLVAISPFMKKKYIQHWILFVQACFLLLQEVVTEEDLSSAEVLLRMFCRDIHRLYGDKQYVYNVHQLIHYVLHTRRWGNLSEHSAFNFESFNGVLSKMFHGSKNVGKELMNLIIIAQGVQMLRTIVNVESQTKNFPPVRLLGLPLTRKLTNSELSCLRNLDDLGSLKLYGRVGVGSELYSSKDYDKQMKRRNSYVEFKLGDQKHYGRILVIVSSGNQILCIIKVFDVVHTKFFYHELSRVRVKHIIPVKDSEEIVACDWKCLQRKLIQVGSYLCYRPNTIERNL